MRSKSLFLFPNLLLRRILYGIIIRRSAFPDLAVDCHVCDRNCVDLVSDQEGI